MIRGASRLALLCSLVALPAAAIEVQYVVSARSDLRSRSPLANDRGATVTMDLELLPNGELALGRATATRFSLQYNPSILWREPQLGGIGLVQHRGRVALSGRWRTISLMLTSDGSYGTTEISALRQPDGALVGSVSAVQSLGPVANMRSATLLAFDATLSRLTSLNLTGGYVISGGLERSPQLPLQYGPTASARFSARATRTDVFITEGQVVYADFETGQRQLIAQATQGWQGQLNRQLSASVAAGVAFTQERIVEVVGGPQAGDYMEVLPVARVGLSSTVTTGTVRYQLGLVGNLAPFADRFTGSVYERAEGRLEASLTTSRRVVVSASAGAAYAVPLGRASQNGDRLYFGEATAGWAAEQWLTLAVNGRLVWSEQPRLGDPGSLLWATTFSITVREQGSAAW